MNRRVRRAAWEVYYGWAGVFLGRNGSLGTNPAGYQCVNVPNAMYELLGLAAITGDASQWIGFHDSRRRWLPSISLDRLRVGDVAVFRTGLVGSSGHVDVVLNGSKRPWVGVDQNWPLGDPVEKVRHYPSDLAGVIRVMSLPGD